MSSSRSSRRQRSRERHQIARREAWRIIKRVLAFARPHWRIFAIALLMTAIYSGANAARVLVLGLVVDGILQPAGPGEEKGKTVQAFEKYLAPHLPDDLQLRRPRAAERLPVERLILSRPESVEIDREGAKPVLRARGVELIATWPDEQGTRSLDAEAHSVEFAPSDTAWLDQPVPALVGGPARLELITAPGESRQLEVGSFVVLDFQRHRRLLIDARVLEFEDGRLAYATAPGAAPDQMIRFESARITTEEVPAPWVGPISAGAGLLVRGFEEAGRGSASMLPILLVLGGLAACLALVIATSNYFRFSLSQLVVFRTIACIRQALFEHLSRLGLDYYSRRRSGDLISRVTNDVGTVQFSLRFFFSNVLQQPFTLVFMLGITFFASWQLTLIALPFLPLLVIPVWRSGRKVHKHGRGSLHKLGELTENMGQLLSGIRVVKAFGLEREQAREFEQRNAGFVRSSMKMVRAKATSRSVVEGIYNLLAALVLVVGGYLLARNVLGLTLGNFAMFVGGMLGMYVPLRATVKAYNTLQESLAGASRIFEVLEEAPTICDAPDAVDAQPITQGIRFQGVWFRYEEEQAWVLRDISFEAPVGATIALVGPTGAGKSTVLDLLARFHEPQQGGVLLDGKDLRLITHASLLRQIAIVGQDPFLFNTTIRENIRHGRQEATDQEVEEAARAAQIHDEIARMPAGYETILGERGMKVSGGQRQRITIARAILKNAPILILDEATSSLDSASERQVQAALDTLMQGRTTFVIAHRLSTIVHADEILVLERGKIVERGTHSTLVARGGLYARLQQLQNGSGTDEAPAATPGLHRS